MLELLSKFICSSIMSLLGFYIIKSIIKSEERLSKKQNFYLLLILIIIPVIIHEVKYTSTYTLITYLLSIIIYQRIFNQNTTQAIISTSIMMIITFIGDLLNAFLYMSFIELSDLRGVWYLSIISNVTLAMICIIICNIKPLLYIIQKVEKRLENIRNVTSICFSILMIIVFTVIEYNLTLKFGWNIEYITNIIIVIIFAIEFVIFLNEKNHNDKLTAEYDNLFNYVQTFEDWIEKEQLNRHEYKNQLAVLRCMTKDKKMVSKIDEILEDSINVEGEVANQLKALPKGGIKGLMYYKAAIAQRKKINLIVDVSLERNSLLKKLTEKDMRILCKLIGIYFDNAIEAAIETRKKIVTVEIYEIKDHISFVISNTFKQHENMERRNEKGVSSKGEGHGNGLYFASKLISKNNWISQKQEIIDKYYIQTLVIKKPDTK